MALCCLMVYVWHVTNLFNHTRPEYYIICSLHTPIPSEAPPRLWTVVAQGLSAWSINPTVDYYSDFWEMMLYQTQLVTLLYPLQKPTLYAMESQRTDNGPHFRSKTYDDDFAKQWEFDHATTSPYHSQSNGKTEAAVKIAKRMLMKISQGNKICI